MKVVETLQDCPKLEAPLSLTIGFFDGVHVGHQKVLSALQGTKACLTFSNHPSEVLTPKEPTPLLCSKKHRIKLLEETGLDLLILIPFTREFSEQSAKTFLLTLRQALPFTHLILGHDAHIGNKREGTPKLIGEIAEEEGFQLIYVDPVVQDDKPVSSSSIRAAIKKGDLDQALRMLGREISYLGEVVEGPHKGREVGFPTANIPLTNLALPPFGVYAVTLYRNGTAHPGIANLGIAPTLHENRVPMLEVFLFNFDQEIYGETVEVVLHRFIRAEKKFASKEALRTQIEKDISVARGHIPS